MCLLGRLDMEDSQALLYSNLIDCTFEWAAEILFFLLGLELRSFWPSSKHLDHWAKDGEWQNGLIISFFEGHRFGYGRSKIDVSLGIWTFLDEMASDSPHASIVTLLIKIVMLIAPDTYSLVYQHSRKYWPSSHELRLRLRRHLWLVQD